MESCREAKFDLPPLYKICISKMASWPETDPLAAGTHVTLHILKKRVGISFWIEQFTGKSCLQRDMCRFHLFCQAPLSVSERHPFHTCQNVFGLKIILRMFRVASRTLIREQCGEAENGTENQENLCLASAENLFMWLLLVVPIPLHLYSRGHKRQRAIFLASSNSWWVLTRELALGGITAIFKGRWKHLFNMKKSFLPEGENMFPKSTYMILDIKRFVSCLLWISWLQIRWMIFISMFYPDFVKRLMSVILCF